MCCWSSGMFFRSRFFFVHAKGIPAQTAIRTASKNQAICLQVIQGYAPFDNLKKKITLFEKDMLFDSFDLLLFADSEFNSLWSSSFCSLDGPGMHRVT